MAQPQKMWPLHKNFSLSINIPAYWLHYVVSKISPPQSLPRVSGDIVTKGEEKAEVLNAFFTSVFNSKTSCSPGTWPPELEDREGEQNEAPIICQ